MTALWTPTLWTPRPWWRLPRFLPAWLTAGKAQRDPTSGKCRRKANGKMAANGATNSNCCCADPCPNCTGAMPNSLTIAFADVAASCGCVQVFAPFGGTPGRWESVVSFNLNGSYDLAKGVPGIAPSLNANCTYFLDEIPAASAVVRAYTNSGCTTFESEAKKLSIYASYYGGQLVVRAAVWGWDPAVTGNLSVLQDLFVGAVGGSPACGQDVEIDNQNTCTAGASQGMAIGGTATLTFSS